MLTYIKTRISLKDDAITRCSTLCLLTCSKYPTSGKKKLKQFATPQALPAAIIGEMILGKQLASSEWVFQSSHFVKENCTSQSYIQTAVVNTGRKLGKAPTAVGSVVLIMLINWLGTRVVLSVFKSLGLECVNSGVICLWGSRFEMCIYSCKQLKCWN